MFHSGVVKDPELGNSVCLCSLTQLENISEQPGEEYWQCLKLAKFHLVSKLGFYV